MVSYMHVVYLTPNFLQVLILIVVDDGLVLAMLAPGAADIDVLILVVVDNGFVLELFMAVKAGKKQS